ncbi:MAG: hypothetical protein DPW18_14395 [Chloroflexi bacterium]|nr:hypothetical protein [Chloroflexota bacterium]MDL1944736.1 transglutaminase domain-containing protein [Chloroflexi bacterium CFX2]
MEKTPRWWDLPSAILLFAATLFSAWRLQSTGWTEGLGHVRNVAVLGLLLGLALGQSRFQRRGVTLLSIGYMLVFFIWQWLGFIEFAEEQTYLGDRLLILSGRLATDLGEFLAGRAVEDQLLVLVLLCIPYWFASLYSGYQLTRHANYLASILPGAILMLVVSIYHYTTKDYTWMFGVYLFLALLLLGRQKYLLDRKKWLRERVQVSSESSLDLNNISIVVAAAMVLLAWGIPYTFASQAGAKEAWQDITGGWFSGERFENLFESVNKEKKPQPRNFQTELALGNQTSQSELVVFLVYVPEAALEYPRLYWRGQIYDRYEGSRWLTTGEDEARHDSALGDLEIPDTDNRRRVSFTYDVYTEGQTILYSAAQPVWMNHDAIILHSKLAEDDETMDVMALRASPRLEAGDLYRVSAMLANPTIPELRAAGGNYPDWVKERYLQLPEDFSPRIRDLAQKITADSATPYDKAAAITEHLRNEINYAPGISIPPDAADPLEYFLFERKQGFCNYYATAEVLMLRAVGIPARLAVGYAQGEPNIQNSIYTVRERDLHAWPEVYFPGYGWIEFEPTVNQEPLNRPLEREEQPVAVPMPNNPVRQLPLGEDELPTPEPEREERAIAVSPALMRWLGALAGIAVFALALVFAKRRLAPDTPVAAIIKNAMDRSGFTPPRWLDSWLLIGSLPPIERYFQSVNLSLLWMGRPQPVHSTAVERARILQKLVPAAAPSVEILLREHHAALFGPHGGDAAAARRAARDILYNTLSLRLKTFILGYN